MVLFWFCLYCVVLYCIVLYYPTSVRGVQKRLFRSGTSTNIQRHCTIWSQFVVICTLGNRFYKQALVFLPTVFVSENMTIAYEDYSKFSDA